MTGTLTVNGMVLSAMPMGEYDKRLTILTVERGKINAFARGARKPNSSLLACSQPFSYGEFTAYAGRDSYTVTNAVVSNYFPELREDLERLYLGMYFCEFADYFTREGNDEREVLGLLYQSLRALGSGKFPPALVRRVYELKLVSIEGEAPQVSRCVCCGQEKEEELSYFSPEKDGVLCASCAGRFSRNAAGDGAGAEGDPTGGMAGAPTPFRAKTPLSMSKPLSAACLYAMQYVVGTPSTKLYRFSLKDEVLAEFGAFVGRYIKKHVGREMKTLQVLKSMGLE